MSRLLIGSSNVYRFYVDGKFASYKPYNMVKCTKIEIYKAKMDALEVFDKEIIISVIENFICDAVRDVADDLVANGMCEQAIKAFMTSLKEAADRLPETRFALVRPMSRPGNLWYSTRYEDILKYFNEVVVAMDKSNISRLDPLSMMSQKFEYDGVHLTQECGAIFIETTLGNAEAFFGAELVELEEEMEVGEASKKVNKDARKKENLSLPIQTKPDILDRVHRLENKVQNMGSDIENRRFYDSLVSARMRDELDASTNVNKEDRIIITGMSNPIIMPQGFAEKKRWMAEMVGKVINKIEQGAAEKIIWINQGRKNAKEIPMAEVRLESKEIARIIRRKFAERKRGGEDMGRLFVANSVTLGTRVRIDILKAIAKKHANDKQDFHVVAYSSRPVLQI